MPHRDVQVIRGTDIGHSPFQGLKLKLVNPNGEISAARIQYMQESNKERGCPDPCRNLLASLIEAQAPGHQAGRLAGYPV